jgi:hypothetical protein
MLRQCHVREQFVFDLGSRTVHGGVLPRRKGQGPSVLENLSVQDERQRICCFCEWACRRLSVLCASRDGQQVRGRWAVVEPATSGA